MRSIIAPRLFLLAASCRSLLYVWVFFQAEDGIRDIGVTGVQTCALPIFSGGYKGVFPAVADVESIMHYHRASVIGHAHSTWGVLEDNPTQDQIRANGSLLPVDFLVNVTLNRKKEITAYFCGDVMAAHERGCEANKRSVMVACEREYPIVVTTNGGYPLDQNLYQAVKGMSAAYQIVSDGGLIVSASRCNDGFPEHGNFRKMLLEHSSPEEMLETIHSRSEEHTSELQSRQYLVCRLLLEKK